MFDLAELENIDELDPAMLGCIGVPAFIVDVAKPEAPVFSYMNPAGERTSGITNDHIAGKRVDHVFPQRVAQSLKENYDRCIARREPITYEEMHDLPLGEIWWQTTLSPVFDREGRVRALIGVTWDITEQKQRSFRDARVISDLRRINEEVRTFASMAAHDLRSPLGNVKVMIDMILMDFQDLGDNKGQMIRFCGDVAEKALHYIDETLTYARSIEIEPATPERVDLGHFLSDVIGLLDPESRLNISFCDLVVRADKPALQLILRNLLDNAAKHANSALTVLARPDPLDAGFMEYTVADDGPGFSAPLVDGELPELSDTDGTAGFGLAAVRRLVQARGGRVRVDRSMMGNGATVRFTLPGSLSA